MQNFAEYYVDPAPSGKNRGFATAGCSVYLVAGHNIMELYSIGSMKRLLHFTFSFLFILQVSVLTPSGASGCSAGSALDGRAGCTLIGQNYKAASMRSWTNGKGRTDTGGIGNAFIYVVPNTSPPPTSHIPRVTTRARTLLIWIPK